MVEPIMYIGIGFLIAGLLVIGVIPLVHARAVRLTMRRLHALTPISMAEIQADKDQLRAEFAMAMSRLEMSVEQMKAKASSQLAEIGRKSEAISRLKFELGEKTAALLAFEAKERQLADEIRTIEGHHASKSGALEETERALASTRLELAQVTADLHQSSMTSDARRVELLASRAQIEVFQSEIESYEQETQELRHRLGAKSGEVEPLLQQLAEERGRADHLANHVGELERQLIAQTTQADVLGRHVQELSARLDEQDRLLADRAYIAERLRNDMAAVQERAAQESEAKLRAALADAETRHRLATETVATEKSLIESELRRSHDERAKLQREIATMKRRAEDGGASERMDSAVLRERIDDVAAEVARLTATLEGPESPINAILSGDAGHPPPASTGANGASPSIAARVGESDGTLADRIRALQGRASRTAAAPRSVKRSAPPRGARGAE